MATTADDPVFVDTNVLVYADLEVDREGPAGEIPPRCKIAS